MDMMLGQTPATLDSATVDKEHQVQIGMLDAFYTLVEQDESQFKIQEMLNQLIAYSEMHFMSEQLLMRMYAYPDYDDHVLDHEAMIEYLNQIKERYLAGEKQFALDTATEMRKFLLAHVGSRDEAFSKYLTSTP